MKKINIDVHKLREKFEEGLESIIYYYNDSESYTDTVLYKRFRSIEYIRNYNDDISPDMMNNKYEKILTIPTLNCLKDEVKLIDIGYENDKFSGYTMRQSSLKPLRASHKIVNNNYVLTYHKPNGEELSFKDKIKYLKLLREKIEKLNDMDVYIGDFNYENFLITDEMDKMILCDLDNLKMWSHDFDNKTASVKKYESSCMNEGYTKGNIDGLDSYCFNIFTLSLLLNQSNFSTLRNIQDIVLPKELESFENNEIIESVKKLDKSYKPRYLIDKFR